MKHAGTTLQIRDMGSSESENDADDLNIPRVLTLIARHVSGRPFAVYVMYRWFMHWLAQAAERNIPSNASR